MGKGVIAYYFFIMDNNISSVNQLLYNTYNHWLIHEKDNNVTIIKLIYI